jgi:hypothetical protein
MAALLAAQACLPTGTMDIVVSLALGTFAFRISLDWRRIGLERTSLVTRRLQKQSGYAEFE